MKRIYSSLCFFILALCFNSIQAMYCPKPPANPYQWGKVIVEAKVLHFTDPIFEIPIVTRPHEMWPKVKTPGTLRLKVKKVWRTPSSLQTIKKGMVLEVGLMNTGLSTSETYLVFLTLDPKSEDPQDLVLDAGRCMYHRLQHMDHAGTTIKKLIEYR